MACRHHDLVLDVASVSHIVLSIFMVSLPFSVLHLVGIHCKSFLVLISDWVLCTMINLSILVTVLKLKVGMALVL